MRSNMPKLLFYYCAIASFVISASLALTTQNVAPFVFALFFLPVSGYFAVEFFKQLRSSFSKNKVEGSDISIRATKTESKLIITAFVFLIAFGVFNIVKNLSKTAQQPQNDQQQSTQPLIFKISNTNKNATDSAQNQQAATPSANQIPQTPESAQSGQLQQ